MNTIRKAKMIVSAGDSITYPSGVSACYVRAVMRELIALVEGNVEESKTEVCDLCLGEGRCPNCGGTGTLPVESDTEAQGS
jgi:hypothetical protein